MHFAGWDKDFGFQLYQSDPSGNYGGWKAAAIGANHQTAHNLLKQDYKEDLSMDQAIELGLKVIAKTMDSTSLSADKLELATMTRGPDGQAIFRILEEAEVKPWLEKVNLEQKDDEE